MLGIAVIVFAVTALAGLILASQVLWGKFAPWSISILHALLGATGLTLLILLLIQGGTVPLILASLVAFLIAALLGFTMAGAFHLRHEIAPKLLVISHATMAVTGFVLLLCALLL